MKKIILIVLSVIGFTMNLQAQEPMKENQVRVPREKISPEDRAQKMIERLNEKITLSEEQKTKVKALALDKNKKTEEIRMKYKGQADKRETAQREIAIVRKDYRKQVKALLTPEQIEKLKAHHKANSNETGGTIEVEDMIEG
ncbi:MAG: hypothetical protein V4565_06175 [Bacteroidota bacterium]